MEVGNYMLIQNAWKLKFSTFKCKNKWFYTAQVDFIECQKHFNLEIDKKLPLKECRPVELKTIFVAAFLRLRKCTSYINEHLL